MPDSKNTNPLEAEISSDKKSKPTVNTAVAAEVNVCIDQPAEARDLSTINVKLASDFIRQFPGLWAKLTPQVQPLIFLPGLSDQRPEEYEDGTQMNIRVKDAGLLIGTSQDAVHIKSLVKQGIYELNKAIIQIAKTPDPSKMDSKRHIYRKPPFKFVKNKDPQIITLEWVDCSMFKGFFSSSGRCIKKFTTTNLGKVVQLAHGNKMKARALPLYFLLAPNRKVVDKVAGTYSFDCSTDTLFETFGLERYAYHSFLGELEGYDLKENGTTLGKLYVAWRLFMLPAEKAETAALYGKTVEEMNADLAKIKPHLKRADFEKILDDAIKELNRVGLLTVLEQEVWIPSGEGYKGKKFYKKKYNNKRTKGPNGNYYLELAPGKHYNFLMQ